VPGRPPECKAATITRIFNFSIDILLGGLSVGFRRIRPDVGGEVAHHFHLVMGGASGPPRRLQTSRPCQFSHETLGSLVTLFLSTRYGSPQLSGPARRRRTITATLLAPL
jgi:hypothetical protein